MIPSTDDPRTAHRPREIDALALEARRLRASGLTTRDVGELLGIGERAVAALLRLDHPAGGVAGPGGGFASVGDSDCQLFPGLETSIQPN
jgi:hypothetical protein